LAPSFLPHLLPILKMGLGAGGVWFGGGVGVVFFFFCGGVFFFSFFFFLWVCCFLAHKQCTRKSTA